MRCLIKESNKKALSTVGLIFIALVWGSSFVIIKDTLNIVPPFTMCMIRFVPATILLALIYIRKLRHIGLNDIRKGSIIGIFMFLSYVTEILAFKYTTASKLAFIGGLSVVFVPFMAWKINKRRPDRYAVAGVILAVIGLGLLTIRKGESICIGDFLALLNAITFAAHVISIEHFAKNSDPIILTIQQFLVTAVGFVALTLMFETFSLDILIIAVPQMAYLVIFCTLIGFIILNVAQRHVSSTSVAMILMLATVVGSVSSIYFLNEYMSMQMVAGGILILLAITTQETKLTFLRKK